MGIFDGALIACDIDGTVMTGGVIPQRNIDAIEYFKSEGGCVCLATGRTAPALRPVLRQYNGYAPCVVGNGCMIYDGRSGEILYERNLDKSEYICIKKAIETDPAVGIEIHSGTTVYKLTETAETKIHQDYEEIDAVPITLEELDNIKICKVLYLFDDEEQKKKIKEAIVPLGKHSQFCDTLVKIYGKTRIYLEHMQMGVTKSAGLIKLTEILNIDRDKFFAIGDGFNDIDMLKTSSFSACPENSVDEVKKNSDVIVSNAENGAVADFIDIIKRRITNGCKEKT